MSIIFTEFLDVISFGKVIILGLGVNAFIVGTIGTFFLPMLENETEIKNLDKGKMGEELGKKGRKVR